MLSADDISKDMLVKDNSMPYCNDKLSQGSVLVLLVSCLDRDREGELGMGHCHILALQLVEF